VVQETLSRLDGVKSVTVDFASARATIATVPGVRIDEAGLNSLFEAKGFPYRATTVRDR